MENLEDMVVVQLMDAAFGEILSHEDPRRYFRWAEREIPRRLGSVLPFEDGGAIRTLSLKLARLFWDLIPLPGNGFRSQPLPRPERNQPCYCGSGRKYKHCCANLPDLPDIEPSEIWILVIPHLDERTLTDAMSARSIPGEAVVLHAENLLRDGHPRKVQRLLDPLFAGALEQFDPGYGFALNALCDAYDDLGWDRKKQALLERAAREGAPHLSAEAWQRICSILIDRSDFDEAWHAFGEAQGSDPLNPALPHLELSLLMSEGRIDQAKQRARFWHRQLERNQAAGDETLAYLDHAGRDPVGAVAGTYLDAFEPAAQRLLDWLQTLPGRPLPLYGPASALPPNVDEPDEMRRHLRERLDSLGVSGEDIDEHIEELMTELDASLDPTGAARGDDPENPGGEGVPGCVLRPPESLRELEGSWRDIYPGRKPFGTSLTPLGDPDPWDAESSDRWLSFLEARPEAGDSLNVLDDLAVAFDLLDIDVVGWLADLFEAPLLTRAEAIVEKALRDQTRISLPWIIGENRPALRLLVRAVQRHERREDSANACTFMEMLLALDHGDSHGMRATLMDHYLREGSDQEAVALAEHYPDDMFAELAFGRVLALYRLDRVDEAATALREAATCLPHVLPYLTAPRPRKPELDPTSFHLGGEDQAWYYRQDARDLWLEVPDLIPWLQENAP